MKCPNCDNNQVKVQGGRQIRNKYRRYRKCLKCGFAFKTIEFVKVEDAHNRLL